ncbi:F-box family protein [Rhynchospora pubera]|uniref:F-box family protein n=1 Tax=Rhynchospora pubera TaxID=906938 RepID=A0AAV8E250_9POAL|nr:F-box family protein [Rhynchospora pubera]
MDWSKLLPELLDVILGKLTEFTDHLRFRCVCRSWLSAAKSHRMPRSLPWLYLPQNPTTTILRFYSFSENKVYKIPFPEAQDSETEVIGSASGFMLIVGHGENPKALMINPFTGTKVHLPYSTNHAQDIQWDYSGSIVVANHECYNGGVYCRPGDRSWSGVDALADCWIHRIVYKAGSFYVLDDNTPVFYVLDDKMLNLTRIIQIPQYDPKNCQLFVSPDEILLSTHYYSHQKKLDLLCFNLNSSLQESSWTKVTDLGNYALFYYETYGMYWDYKFNFLFEARQHTGLRNTIISYRLSPFHKDTMTCYIDAHNLTATNELTDAKCFYPSYTPFWVPPNFDTA